MITDKWQVAQRSGDAGNCAEVRRSGNTIEIRNNTSPAALPIGFTPAEWTAFVESVKDGQYDL